MGSLAATADLLRFLVYAQLKSEAARGFLGILWWVIEPALFMGAFYLVFSAGLRGTGPDYVPFLLTGLVTWKWFASTISQGSHIILSKGNLIRQVYIHKLIFPIVLLIANSIKFFFSFLVLAAVLVSFGYSLSPSWLALPLLMFAQLLFIAFCVCVAATFVPLVPDLKILIETALLFLFFISGIFFDIHKTEDNVKSILAVNPMAVLIDNYRAILLRGEGPNYFSLVTILVLSFVGLVLLFWLFGKLDRIYPKLVP